ncbi:MAG: methyltransferase [Candidatus Bathyarchaeota archaeon]|uniref:class I SAM-dependent methyltransferase n=1 Tax=Candidatus Bathycorpusculum sp. TaxID=2994959 RepID=UPI00283A3354|nr:methyltransferase [Candidatus Termiticorpusculum sp.]MCL2257094.1 methyltransferase [Candidatus Termiticorpusculum sp.]MCL2292761.1 methyltransferase [Candidatus Termiticorpusculum sp.]
MIKNKKEPPISDHYFSSSPQSEANYGLVRAKFFGRSFEFITASSVFSKRRIDTGTQLLIESMILPEEGSVLDIGCGYGAVGITAATLNAKLQVYLTDVNARAVDLAKKNVERNRVFNAHTRHGYLYEPVKDLKFDCILSNPPVSAGMETVKAIITGAPKIMRSNAVFEMVIRSKIGAKLFPTLFTETFGNYTVTARGSGFRVLTGKNSKN